MQPIYTLITIDYVPHFVRANLLYTQGDITGMVYYDKMHIIEHIIQGFFLLFLTQGECK